MAMALEQAAIAIYDGFLTAECAVFVVDDKDFQMSVILQHAVGKKA